MAKYDGTRIMGRKAATMPRHSRHAVVRDAVEVLRARAVNAACRQWLTFSLIGVAAGAAVAWLFVSI